MTSNQETYAKAHYLANSVTVLRAALYDGAMSRIAEAEGGLSAGCFDAVSGRGGHSDAVASWAARGIGAAAAHRDELVRALDAAQKAVNAALRIVQLYPPPHVGDDDDREALARINGRREPCCENCAQIRNTAGVARWEPIDSRLSAASTVGGRLDEPKLLCVWCVEKVRSWGRLPRPDELRRHHEGQRVPWPADVERTA